MRESGLPTFYAGPDVDKFIMDKGFNPFRFHCAGCHCFGNDWIDASGQGIQCPCCGRRNQVEDLKEITHETSA